MASGAKKVAEEIKAKQDKILTDEEIEQQRELNRERVRRHRARKKGEAEEGKPEPYRATEEGIKAAAMLGNVGWNLSRIFTHHRALTLAEKLELGAALDPVLHKYLPVLDNWKEEVTLLMCIWALYDGTAPPREAGETDAKPNNGGIGTEGEREDHLGQGVHRGESPRDRN